LSGNGERTPNRGPREHALSAGVKRAAVDAERNERLDQRRDQRRDPRRTTSASIVTACHSPAIALLLSATRAETVIAATRLVAGETLLAIQLRCGL
jgi:hypothetical protein